MTKNYKWERERLSRFCTWCEIVFRYDKEADFPFVEVDDGFCRMLGYEREELMESCHERIRYLIYPPDFQRIEQDTRNKENNSNQKQTILFIILSSPRPVIIFRFGSISHRKNLIKLFQIFFQEFISLF